MLELIELLDDARDALVQAENQGVEVNPLIMAELHRVVAENLPFVDQVDRLALALTDGDGTFRVNSGAAVVFATGFQVGGRVLPLQGQGVSTEALRLFVSKAILRGDPFIGSWTDPTTGIRHFDVSDHVQNRDIALAAAANRGEIAVWDWENMVEVGVPSP